MPGCLLLCLAAVAVSKTGCATSSGNSSQYSSPNMLAGVFSVAVMCLPSAGGLVSTIRADKEYRAAAAPDC